MDVSRSILANYGDVKNLNYATLNKLKSLKGVGEVKATVILASIELGRRIYQTNTALKKYNINNPRDIVSYYKEVFKDKKQEELDNKCYENSGFTGGFTKLEDGTIVDNSLTKDEFIKKSINDLPSTNEIPFYLDENGNISGEEYIKTFEEAGIAVRGFYN